MCICKHLKEGWLKRTGGQVAGPVGQAPSDHLQLFYQVTLLVGSDALRGSQGTWDITKDCRVYLMGTQMEAAAGWFPRTP
jgi:hypothetical protein